MNLVLLTGRTTKDFSMYSTQNGASIAKSIVAVDKGFGEKKKTSFIGITAFGKTAEFCNSYVNKGDLIEVVGSIETGQYKRSDGTTVFTTDILVDEIKKLSTSKGQTEARKRDDFVKYDNSESTAEPQYAQLDEDMPF